LEPYSPIQNIIVNGKRLGTYRVVTFENVKGDEYTTIADVTASNFEMKLNTYSLAMKSVGDSHDEPMNIDSKSYSMSCTMNIEARPTDNY